MATLRPSTRRCLPWRWTTSRSPVSATEAVVCASEPQQSAERHLYDARGCGVDVDARRKPLEHLTS